uniref:Uncharacterized protein n=1 Tax=Arundo donax TaxID=35708 RepID=A0A0A8Y5Z8_ARUDO
MNVVFRGPLHASE